MSRNKTDHVYRESHMEWLVGMLRQLEKIRNVVQYQESDSEEYLELKKRLNLSKKDPDKRIEEAVSGQLRIKLKHGSRKPAEVRQLVETPHTRDVLMELVAFGAHFRQDEEVWNSAVLSHHFHNVNGGVS